MFPIPHRRRRGKARLDQELEPPRPSREQQPRVASEEAEGLSEGFHRVRLVAGDLRFLDRPKTLKDIDLTVTQREVKDVTTFVQVDTTKGPVGN